MKKYDKIKRAGHQQNQEMLKQEEGEIVIKEKVDGANFRFKVTEDGELLFGSKNVEYSDEDGNPVYEGEVVDSRFKPYIDYIREVLDPERILNAYGSHYTYFVEATIPHSLQYDDSIPEVLGFDIYDEKREMYLPVKIVAHRYSLFGIEHIPIVEVFNLEDKDFKPEEYDILPSQFREGKMEGVVIINQDMEENDKSGFNSRAKMVTEEFKEKHKEATGARQSVEAVKGHEKIVSKYCTDGRIRKHIHKMIDRDRELGMQLMESKNGVEGLPMRVSTDIMVEEADSIVRRNDEMEFKEFRKLVAKRCVHVLRQEIQRNASS